MELVGGQDSSAVPRRENCEGCGSLDKREDREGECWEKDDLQRGWERGDSWPQPPFPVTQRVELPQKVI